MRESIQKGFSLIEALIAIAILASIAAALAPAIQSSLRVSTRIASFGEKSEEIRIGIDAIEEIFAAMMAPSSGNFANGFSGSPSSLEFTVLLDPMNGPQTVKLTIEKNKLIYHAEPPVVLLTGVGRFRYFGRVGDEAPSWHSDWHELNAAEIVEIAGTPLDSSKTPPLAFHIASTAPLYCPFDPVSRTCRR
ncbi:MAG: prepilin-type N-terminal cleavage/methylation domain-containing protein [Amphiplicatus sp.]